MKKQDLVKLAVLGLMGVGTSVGALQQQQSPQPPSIQGQQPAATMPHSCGQAGPTSAYSSSDTDNKTNGPINYQIPTGKPANQQPTNSSCQAYSQPQNGGQSSSNNNYRNGSYQGYSQQPQNPGSSCNAYNSNR